MGTLYLFISQQVPFGAIYVIPLDLIWHMSLSARLYLSVCCCLVTMLCLTLFRPYGLQPARLLCPWDFSAKNTVMGCHAHLQGIFPTQGLNPYLLLGRQILYH